MNIQAIGSNVSTTKPVVATPQAPATQQKAQPDGVVANGQPALKAEAKETPEELQGAVDAVNNFVSSINDSLHFSIDEDTGKTIVKVIDATTKEVIKQIPSEEMVAIAKALDKLQGVLVQQKA